MISSSNTHDCRVLTCNYCHIKIAESDKLWDIAHKNNLCPNCDEVLNLSSSNTYYVDYSVSTNNLISSKQVFLIFGFLGPLLGAIPFFLMPSSPHKEGFLVILLTYVFGIIPSIVASLFFISFRTKLSRTKHYDGFLYGAISGFLGTLPLALIFYSTQSLFLISFIAIIGLFSGGICGFVSKQ